MRIIFSRKGFDSAAGKAPSPIIDGEPISLPIPTERRSETSYRLAGLGEIVEHMTKPWVIAHRWLWVECNGEVLGTRACRTLPH